MANHPAIVDWRAAWLFDRLTSAADLSSSEIADYFRQLAAANTEEDRNILVAAEGTAAKLGLDDDLLESLLADLGLA